MCIGFQHRIDILELMRIDVCTPTQSSALTYFHLLKGKRIAVKVVNCDTLRHRYAFLEHRQCAAAAEGSGRGLPRVTEDLVAPDGAILHSLCLPSSAIKY